MAKKILYIWKDKYPWDVRVAKFCNSLAESGYEIHMLARSCSEELQSGKIDDIYIHKLELDKSGFSSLPVPFNPRWKRFIKRKIAEINPDLIIIREIMLGETAGKIAKENNIPIIMDMAENYPAAMREWKKYNSSRISKYIMQKNL